MNRIHPLHMYILHFTIKATSSYLASKHKTTIFLANPPYATSFASFYYMRNLPQQDVCFNIWVDKKTLSPKKHLTNLACKICTSRFITLSGITSSHKHHFPALANSTHPMQSKPHNPPNKMA
jgi:hypothetical protein